MNTNRTTAQENTIRLWNESLETEIAALAAHNPSMSHGELRQRAVANLADKYPHAHRAYLNAYNGIG